MANNSRKIYNITVDGNSITYFNRVQGQSGRDIAAIKLALGDIYMAPKQNDSPEDETTGEAWFSCETNQELSIERLVTFDKKLKSSLMAFQIEHQLLILSYYFEKYFVANIRTDDEESLARQYNFMLSAFDTEFGTIGESTIAILHGYRPGANAFNTSFVCSEKYPIDMIPRSLYDSYMSGNIAAMPSTILMQIVKQTEDAFEGFENTWRATVSASRNWSTKVPQIEVCYAKYIAHSYINNLAESDLYVATKEMLNFVNNPQYTEELTPAQRERLVSRAFEPDHLQDPDPFIISVAKIGFFDRTEYTFRSLPDFENTQPETRQQLELSALNKVLDFYGKASVISIQNPMIINLIDFRTPSLRPGDVYRAYFEIDREILDSMPEKSTDPVTINSATDSASAAVMEMEKTKQQINDLHCADGGDPSDEDVRIQYERYKSFAAKKKLEIARKIRQAALRAQEDTLSIDGIEVDLGIFGKGSMSESEIQNLLASGASALTGLAIEGISSLAELSTAGDASSDKLVISYNKLVEYINTVAENFENAQKDLANFQLSGDPYFTAVNEAAELRKIPEAVSYALGGDQTLRAAVASVTDLQDWIKSDDTFLTFKFGDIPGRGSEIISIHIHSVSKQPTVNNRVFAKEQIAEQIETGQNQLQPQEGFLKGPLRRYRTIHYLRNIEDLFGKSSTVRGFLDRLANPQSTCDTEEEEKTGTGAEYILRYTLGVGKKKAANSYSPLHNWRNPAGKKAIDNITKEIKSIQSRKDKEYYGFIKTGVELEKAFGFDKILPELGPEIDTTSWESGAKDLSDKLLKELSSLLDYKRLLCEYAACLGIPDVQVSLPNISLPDWPKLPMLELPGSDFKEKMWQLVRDIVYRALYTFIKGIIDILKTPFCSEKFIEDLYGAASDTSPLIKKALAEGFLDTGIPASKTQNSKDLIDALLGLLTPSELCALLNGEIVNDSVYHIIRATAEALNLKQELETEEQITNFFITLGVFVGPEICDNLSRYSNQIETCEDVYSIVGQIRSAILKGEGVTESQLNAAATAAQEEYQKKKDALDFLTGEGGLADLLPDLSSLENNIAFSTPSDFVVDSAKLAASSALKLSKTSFVRSLNSFVSSFYVDEQRIAQPGDDVYESEANRILQRATCNLQRFAVFADSPRFRLDNLANRNATDTLREALIILSDDYKTTEISTDSGNVYDVYTLTDNSNSQSANGNLLQNPLSEEYPLFDSSRAEALTLSLSTNLELSKVWEYLFPISAGDLNETTRTISNFGDWHKPIFRGEDISALDVITLNTSLLNKMNQIISRLQQDITSNVEKAFRITPDSKFLSVIDTFYNIEEEAIRDTRGPFDRELIKAADYATSIELLHPVLPEDQAKVKFTDDRRIIAGEPHVLTRVALQDDFFFGTEEQSKFFTSCDKIPDSLIEAFNNSDYTRDVKKTLFTDFFKKNINQYLRSYNARDLILTTAAADDILKREFKEVNEGIIEQLTSEIRDSRIFKDADYLARMDSKLRSRFYYDPSTKCFKNPNNLLKYGLFNFDKIVVDEFESQYRKEYARPENSDILRDYTKPGAFEKALMNTSVLGFIRVALIDLLLKGSITFSVWDFDFLKNDKFFRNYIVSFVENQLSKQDFFEKNRERLDETLIRLSGINNISASIKKITLREVDTLISDLSKGLFENDSNLDYDVWFLDNIPLVQVATEKQSQRVNTIASLRGYDLWVSNLSLDEVRKFRRNSFSFLEEYIRIQGPLRDFRSSYSQIASAQANKLLEVRPRLQQIARDTNLEMPTMNIDRISSSQAIDIDTYNDTDNWPNRELVSIGEFSEIIRSLLDNNTELSKYFHDFQNKIYDPENPTIHGAPETIREKFPHKLIVRTRKRYEFSGANIFSSLFSPANTWSGANDGSDSSISAHAKKRRDKFRIQNKVNIQPTDSGYYWGLVNESQEISDGIVLDINNSELEKILRKSFSESEEYETRYYSSTVTLEDAISRYNSSDIGPSVTLDGPRRPSQASIDQSGDSLDSISNPSNYRRIFGDFDAFGLNDAEAGRDNSRNEDLVTMRIQRGPRRSANRTLFENIDGELTEQQFNNALSSSVEPEYWEETVIDLVGDASPIFNQPGDSEWDPYRKFSQAQKVEMGRKVNNMKAWLEPDARERLRRASTGVTNQNRNKFIFTVGRDGDKITTARLSNKFGQIIHDKDGYGWDWDGNHYHHELPGTFDLTYASNNIRFNKGAGLSSPRIFQIDEPHELLGLNDYKVPLRLLITQIKNAQGEVLQVYLKYVIPEVVDFSGNSTLDYAPHSSYRSEALVRACKETIDSYERFMAKTMYDIMQELKVSNRTLYEGYRSFYPNKAVSETVINRGYIAPHIQANAPLIHGDTGRNAVVPPPFRYPGTGDDYQMNVPYNYTLAASWMSTSKIYSIAAQNEAKEKTRNFKTDSDFLDRQFKLTGGLVRHPKLGLTKSQLFDLFELPNNPNNQNLKTLRLYYKLQEHYLYQNSIRDLLDPLTGRSRVSVANFPEKALQTIGNFVSWFNQRRADAFFGFTTRRPRRIITAKELLQRGEEAQQEAQENNWSNVESPATVCGPSLFYNDGRSHTITALAAVQSAWPNYSSYPSAIAAIEDFYKYIVNNDTTPGYWNNDNYDRVHCISQPFTILGPRPEYRFYMSSLRQRAQQGTLFGRPGEVLLPNMSLNSLGPVSIENLKQSGLYTEPNSVIHDVIDSGYSPSQIFQEIIESENFDSYFQHEYERAQKMPEIIASVSAQYNAALETTGLPQIIREVTTTYVSRLEGDETIVTDILRDSNISHGIRIMQANPYEGSRDLDSEIALALLENSEVSEEERMGIVLIGDVQYRTYPVSSYEQELTSLQCFMAETPTQFRQKLQEQLPYMKCKLQNEQSYKDFFDFIVPYKTYASMLAMHGITMLAGYGDMPTIMDSAKSGLAGAFSQAAEIEIPGQEEFGINFDNADLVTAFGTPGPVGGQEIDCFDLPNIGQWWKLIQEMLKQYIKYFPSVILRGIADSIDPAYKEMKRHYLSCELPDLTNNAWVFGSGNGDIPLGLRGGQRGDQTSKYAPLIPSFPYDVVKGVSRLPNPTYLLKSVDKLIGYIYGGPLPLLDPRYAFKIPCLEIDQKSPNSWAPYNVGNSGRYGHPLGFLTALALSTYQLPNDMEMRRSICNRNNIPDAYVVACEDEQE